MNHGARPIPLDRRDFSFHKTFKYGSVLSANIADFNLDAGVIMPNQNVPEPLLGTEAQPYGCTNFITCLVCSDEDGGVLYSPAFQESLTHANALGGYDIRRSLLSAINVGVRTKDEPDSAAASHRRSALFRVGQLPDYFYGMLTAMAYNKRPISFGSPFFPTWLSTGKDGIVPVTDYTLNPLTLPWHNYELCGQKTIDGKPRIIAKWIQGKDLGDGGYSYFSQEDINAICKINGTGGFTVAPLNGVPARVGYTYFFEKRLDYHDINAEVANLQKALQSLGYAIVDAPTQIYGAETKAALARFQLDYGIDDDGSHFGPLTRYRMNRILNPAQNNLDIFIIFVRSVAGL